MNCTLNIFKMQKWFRRVLTEFKSFRSGEGGLGEREREERERERATPL